MNSFNFNVISNGKGPTEMPKEKEVSYPFRFRTKEKYLYVSRIAFFHEKSINETMDSLLFGRDWSERNEEYRAKQKKLGISDAEIRSRRKKRLRRWRLNQLKKAA